MFTKIIFGRFFLNQVCAGVFLLSLLNNNFFHLLHWQVLDWSKQYFVAICWIHDWASSPTMFSNGCEEIYLVGISLNKSDHCFPLLCFVDSIRHYFICPFLLLVPCVCPMVFEVDVIFFIFIKERVGFLSCFIFIITLWDCVIDFRK